MHIVIMKEKNLHQLVWMSRPLMQAAEACVEAGLNGTALTVRMRAVLEILHRHGAMTVPDIAAKLEIQRQYVQVMCNETLSSGLVEQRPNPRHKRSPILALTESGSSLITTIIAQELAILHEVGRDLSEEDISTALRVVLAVTERLKAQSGKDR
ncbi:MarR family winged helix-turn-helix transcriptional regulator [Thioclava sp. FR2]|uniref:MarR family winged helix-turn-helix transcriptional regulator n=1 Tax=Thioclava sp. FR2 TaxID=3445780 RepID=UPI003EBF4E53